MSCKTEAEINAEKASKPALDAVPPELMLAAGRALGNGKTKHGIATSDGWGTWRVAWTQQAEPLTHYACLMRHMLLWRAGEERDPESGLSHLDHAAAQLAILLDLLARPVGPAPKFKPVLTLESVGGDLDALARGPQYCVNADGSMTVLTDFSEVGDPVCKVTLGAVGKDPDNDEDWPLPEGWVWLPECGPKSEEWYARDLAGEGTICPDPTCCSAPVEVVSVVRARNEAARG